MDAFDEIKLLGKEFLTNHIEILYKWSGLKAIDHLKRKT
jgi:hypothetical protein